MHCVWSVLPSEEQADKPRHLVAQWPNWRSSPAKIRGACHLLWFLMYINRFWGKKIMGYNLTPRAWLTSLKNTAWIWGVCFLCYFFCATLFWSKMVQANTIRLAYDYIDVDWDPSAQDSQKSMKMQYNAFRMFSSIFCICCCTKRLLVSCLLTMLGLRSMSSCWYSERSQSREYAYFCLASVFTTAGQ